ncbi:MAG TPA: acyl-CoA dehydrogenase family protein, partial [Dehalococcoidia bacterium]|nr:acyl-CoA dehydrogenase family protein [Dehalococcoidia bacterium]
MTMTAAMLDAVDALARRCEEREAAAPDAFSQESLDDVKRSSLLLAPLRESAGGQSCTLADAVVAIETLARHSPSVALLASMPLGLSGVVESIAPVVPEAHAASWAQQADEFATSVRAGAWYAAANSEKGAGGSLDALKTVAARDADGTWRVTGEKILASSGRYATYFFSLAKVDAADLPGAGVAEM